jgi:magnesium transporter
MLATRAASDAGYRPRMDVLTAVDDTQLAAHHDRDQFFWLDLESPAADELDTLERTLGLHPMALEDTREFGQRPKVDSYQDHVLLVFYTAQSTADEERVVEPVEVHIYISGRWIVTVRNRPCRPLDELHDALVPEGTDAEDYIVYRILDALTDAWFPAIAALEDRIDALEGDVLEQPRRHHLRRVYRVKQEVHELQRLTAGQRDQFQTASSAILDLAGLSHGQRAYLRDVADHLAQIGSELQRQNDDLVALTSIYFSASTDKVSRTTTRLTVLASFFVAWTLVTGFFGQNFRWLVDNVSSRTDFLLFGVGGFVIPTVVLATVLWIKRHDWF